MPVSGTGSDRAGDWPRGELFAYGDGGCEPLIPKRLPPGKLTEHLRRLTVSESLPPSPEHNALDRQLALDTIHLVTLVELTVMLLLVQSAALRQRRIARTTATTRIALMLSYDRRLDCMRPSIVKTLKNGIARL